MKRFESSSKQIEGDRFESLIKWFESHVKKKKKLRAIDSNPHLAIRIPHEEHKERTEERIRISYTTIRIPKTGVLKNKARRFKSSNYRFESLGKSKGRRLKVRKSDSNLRVTDSNPSWRKIQISLRRFESSTQRSNPWLCKSIKCATCNSIYPIFMSNLSRNG